MSYENICVRERSCGVFFISSQHYLTLTSSEACTTVVFCRFKTSLGLANRSGLFSSVFMTTGLGFAKNRLASDARA